MDGHLKMPAARRLSIPFGPKVPTVSRQYHPKQTINA